MAQVTLDASEFDMLRENKAKAESEVKELKKIIEDLKSQSRVIVKYKVPRIDEGFILRTVEQRPFYNRTDLIQTVIDLIVDQAQNYMHDEYVNFSDVKESACKDLSIQYEQELQQKSLNLERAKKQYVIDRESIKNECEAEYKGQIHGLNNQIIDLKKNIDDLILKHQSEQEAAVEKEHDKYIEVCCTLNEERNNRIAENKSNDCKIKQLNSDLNKLTELHETLVQNYQKLKSDYKELEHKKGFWSWLY